MYSSTYYRNSREQHIQEESLLPKNHDELPKDTITHIEWMEEKPFFGVTSFDGTFRIYQIFSRGNNGHFELVYIFQYAYPLLSFKFLGQYAFLGSADGKVLSVEIGNSGKVNSNFHVFGEHKGPVFKIFFDKKNEKLISVDTIENINIFDMKRKQLENSIKANGKIQDCDFQSPLLVLALTEQKIQIISFENNAE